MLLAELSSGGRGRESGPAPARISLCFEILGILFVYIVTLCSKRTRHVELIALYSSLPDADKLIPQLGVFQRVMRMVREELFGQW